MCCFDSLRSVEVNNSISRETMGEIWVNSSITSMVRGKGWPITGAAATNHNVRLKI